LYFFHLISEIADDVVTEQQKLEDLLISRLQNKDIWHNTLANTFLPQRFQYLRQDILRLEMFSAAWLCASVYYV